MLKNSLGVVLVCLGSLAAHSTRAATEVTEATVLRSIEQAQASYTELALRIYELAELGYLETESSAGLQALLSSQGFAIEAGVAGIPTAFVASYGSGEPIVAVLGEFDALPGISQAVSPVRQIVPGRPNAHACGHHLFAVGSAAAAIAVKQWLVAERHTGTIRFYGTPAEEGGAGKAYMVRARLFDDVDAVLHWHPDDRNNASPYTTLANRSAKFRFHGVSSHAGSAPEAGRSALDGVEAMNYMVNLMREHVPSEARIHYVITAGGSAPNVVPDFAEVFYYVRAPDAAQVEMLWERLVAAAEGAAQGTSTRVEFEVIHGAHSMLPSLALSEVMDRNLRRVGGVSYDTEEAAFAAELYRSFDSPPSALGSQSGVEPFASLELASSTDVGDVSWVAPTAGVRIATWVPGTVGHSWQAVAAGGMDIGLKGMLVAAKTLALSAIDLYEQPEVLAAAAAELAEQRGPDFTYRSLLGDRPPALDYRR
jgi:aminobenzoyl-glutamate utilization protein B